jgi:hypothetical protein
MSSKHKRTIIMAAFVGFNFGLGFSILGAGGGRAAVCGAAASSESEVAEGTTTGGELASGGGWPSRDRSADIIASRIGTTDVDVQGKTNGSAEWRAACWRRMKRTVEEDIGVQCQATNLS